MTAVGMLMRRHRLAREAAEASAETASFPDGEPTKDWNKAQIVAYLATVGVEASESKKKDDLLALVPVAIVTFDPSAHELAEVLEYLQGIDNTNLEAHDAEVLRVVEAEKTGLNRPEVIELIEGTPGVSPVE